MRGGSARLRWSLPIYASRLVHDEGSMGIVGDMAGYLDQMLVHGAGITPRHGQGCRLAVPLAGRADDVGGTPPITTAPDHMDANGRRPPR